MEGEREVFITQAKVNAEKKGRGAVSLAPRPAGNRARL